MKNIVLICAAGMSASLLVNKMKKYSEEINYDANINAYPMSEVDEYGKDADIILLGPQVRFNLDKVKEAFPEKPVEVIDMMDYGMMNGEKVIKNIISVLGEWYEYWRN